MRRLTRRALLASAAALSRLARRLENDPRTRRAEPWFRDGGDRTLRLEYPLDADSIVLDLGGYEGQWASDIFGRYGCTVHVFEPVPAFAEAIGARFSRNPRIHVHEVGLAATTREEMMGLGADASSLYDRTGVQVRVRLVRADEFLETQGIGRVDLMKVNIEGGEYELLEHLLETGWLPRIRDLQVQFHDFVPDAEARMTRIQARLRETHAPTYQYPFVWENWRRR